MAAANLRYLLPLCVSASNGSARILLDLLLGRDEHHALVARPPIALPSFLSSATIIFLLEPSSVRDQACARASPCTATSSSRNSPFVELHTKFVALRNDSMLHSNSCFSSITQMQSTLKSL
ncbi:hypothetical protein Mapa_015999 [Marchantia paleacea]|nr:hypothetical protein Mapa_015999 [Marchantia paleacea]